MGNQQTVLFLPDDAAAQLLSENEIDLLSALAERGLGDVRLTLAENRDPTSREPVTALIVASAVAVAALGVAIGDIVRALATRPMVVKTQVVQLAADGSLIESTEERIVQPEVAQGFVQMQATLPFGIKVSVSSGAAHDRQA